MINPPENSENYSDEKLLFLCKKYGTQSKLWRQKFLGLLPEVAKRNIHIKKGFHSIFEFAAKLAGVSEKQVRLVLNMQKQFIDKPQLQNLLINGQVSANKLARIVSIATKENQQFLADQVQLLPQKALELLVRDEKLANNLLASSQAAPQLNLERIVDLQIHISNSVSSICSFKFTSNFNHFNLRNSQFDQETLHAQKSQLQLSSQTVQELLDLQGKGLDINAIIQTILKNRKLEIASAKEQFSTEAKPTKSRYIPQKIKNILHREYGNQCSIKTCKNPSKEIHHTQRFALSKTHDPKYMAPLCSQHHQIAQTIDIKYHQVRQFVTIGSIK